MMVPKFDIFQKLSDGQPLWIRAVESLKESERQLDQLMFTSPGNYFIFDSSTGSVIDGRAKAA